MSHSPAETTATAANQADECGSEFSDLHPDIIQTHILTRLDGPSLASASSCSATLHRLSSQHQLWSDVCQATWPSTVTPRVKHIISTFPDGGSRAFFAHSFSFPPLDFDSSFHHNRHLQSPPGELISAVDMRYKDKLIFSGVQETETLTDWFRCSPFRVDLLEPKDVVPTPIQHPDGDDTCLALIADMTLSWILMDDAGRRALNLSSQRPVSVERHWLSGEVQVRFSSVLARSQKGGVRGHVLCGIVVTCGRSEGGEMQIREVCMEMEDMDGTHLNGKDSLVILQRALEGKKGKVSNREEAGRERYKDYVEMKRARKERKLRTEGALDILCVAFGVSFFIAFWGFVWSKM